jgi:hypothetical protein
MSNKNPGFAVKFRPPEFYLLTIARMLKVAVAMRRVCDQSPRRCRAVGRQNHAED